MLVTVSDRRLSVDDGEGAVAYYEADVVSANDYYPGGMLMPSRELNSSSYRYSINGQEKTPEIAPNTTTAEFWQYDARIVRRWNLDPVYKYSPYSAFAGNPMWYTDGNGLDTTGPRTTPQKGGCEKCEIEELEDGDYFSDVQDQTFTATFEGVS